MSRVERSMALLRAVRANELDDLYAEAAAISSLGERSLCSAGGIIMAAFTLLVRRRFVEGTDVRLITYFVTDALSSVAARKLRLPTRVGQALVRAVLGEEELFASIPEESALPVAAHLLLAIADDLTMDDAQLQGLVLEADEVCSAAASYGRSN
jgi:hypothetical protein